MEIKSKDLSLTETAWVVFGICAVIATAFFFYHFQVKEKVALEDQLDRYAFLFEEYYGKDEAAFRAAGNFINVPNQLWDENITVKEVVQAYQRYKPVSTYLIQKELESLCSLN